MLHKIEFNHKALYNDLMYLLKTPGPTQACVKISDCDPRIDGDFPMKNAIEKIVQRINDSEKVDLQLIRHMGNLLLIGGLGKKFDKIQEGKLYNKSETENIKKIPVIFGAHLDEISFIITKKSGFIDGENWQIFPLCAPPKVLNFQTIKKSDDKTIIAREIHHPECKIVGFRNGKFIDNIGEGMLYKVLKIDEITETVLIDKKERKIRTTREKDEQYLIVKILDKNIDIKEGDIVIQDYGDWKANKKFKDDDQIITSKALDDRIGCIASIYAVKELAKIHIPSKAILTSSEEGVPNDVSWGRLIRSTYKKFCTDEVITLVCDGIDGKELFEFPGKNKELEQAISIPYTSFGKGGGDIGIFSRIRDNVIPELNKVYDKEIVVTSTDYSSRSFEVKIMDDWTNIGFIQWSCGKPVQWINGIPIPDDRSVCHNHETVCFQQVINIIRTLSGAFEYFHKSAKLHS